MLSLPWCISISIKNWGKVGHPLPLMVICELLSSLWYCIFMTMASPDSKCKVSLKGTLQCKVVNSLIHGFIQSGQDEFLSFKQLCIVMMNRTELLSYEHCACFYGQFHQLIIIYYTDILARVKILHVRQSQSRYVSHLQIQHMVYTDTGDYNFFSLECF